MNATGIGLVVVALSSASVAAPAGWFAYDLLAKPGVIREQQVICRGEVEAGAAKATRDEQLRQFRAGEFAAEQFIHRGQEAADDAQAKTDLLELEIEHYAQRVAETRAVCSLDIDDLRLLGVPQPGSTAPGGR